MLSQSAEKCFRPFISSNRNMDASGVALSENRSSVTKKKFVLCIKTDQAEAFRPLRVDDIFLLMQQM